MTSPTLPPLDPYDKMPPPRPTAAPSPAKTEKGAWTEKAAVEDRMAETL